MRVLVTGAASGLGRATVLRLARDAQARATKAMVAAVDIGPSPGLDGVIEELRKPGADALPLHGDLAADDVPARVVDEAGRRFGGLDGRARAARHAARRRAAAARRSGGRRRAGAGRRRSRETLRWPRRPGEQRRPQPTGAAPGEARG